MYSFILFLVCTFAGCSNYRGTVKNCWPKNKVSLNRALSESYLSGSSQQDKDDVPDFEYEVNNDELRLLLKDVYNRKDRKYTGKSSIINL